MDTIRQGRALGWMISGSAGGRADADHADPVFAEFAVARQDGDAPA